MAKATDAKLLEVSLNVEKAAAQSFVYLVSGGIDFVNGVATVTDEQYKELLAAGIVKEVKEVQPVKEVKDAKEVKEVKEVK